jgi:hypothetical protein
MDNLKKIFTGVLLLGLFFIPMPSCSDRSQMLNQISFSINVNVFEPAFFDLTVPTGWVYYNGNTVDLIIYRNDLDVFSAFDARSTHNPSNPCYVKVNADNVTISDTCSGSKWLLSDGSLINGPAQYNLLKYNADYNSVTGYLHLYN